MNKAYKQLINDLIERYSFAIHCRGQEAELMARESFAMGVKGLMTAAFSAEDIDAFKELKTIHCFAEEEGLVPAAYNLGVSA